MNKLKIGAILLLAVINTGFSQTKPKERFSNEIDFSNAPKRVNNVSPLSDQANKKNWVLSDKMSDEFDSKRLDTRKWHPNNPGWKGRKPTFFHGSNVSLKDDELVFKINQHSKHEELPEGYTHTAGFIKSKQKVLYGYFEAEMKLMDDTWVSGFWACLGTRDWWTEIDFCENSPATKNQQNDLNSNIHVFRSPDEYGGVKKHFSRNNKYKVPFNLLEDYHVWGIEWDEDYIRFYIDGVLFREAENTHWYQPLEINFNNESNKWFGALPSDKSKLDQEFRVKYFRYWSKGKRLKRQSKKYAEDYLGIK
ncbi:beta-glucanase (GH16 family) [Wenyingzhuangia heitensis]|uniref:Beta-glucanase (GH16 family) n=1 Tax=Wenyingzhuangia heitensis TaxID=1487859 RepID=A0ABX0UD58_9FLAO|nr:family 16 glycosylhydrolase [Wenyingzhuangia heitensis]NIJ45002.1 beta-glucanase (GH16 family) [Wenyingzhuangia heitensis]